MPKFLKNIVRDFLNIYVEEAAIRESFGDEYADRYSNRDPKTGRKMVSGLKIFTRIVIVFVLTLYIFYIARILTA